jgi:hypothetical protein
MTDLIALGLNLINRLPFVHCGATRLIARHFLQSAGKDLEQFRCWDDGLRNPLKRIADQGSSPIAVKEIEKCLIENNRKFSRLARRLLQTQRRMSSFDGCDWVVRALDEVFGVRSGPVWVLSWLWQLLDRGECSRDEALSVLNEMERTNGLLYRLREAIHAELCKQPHSERSDYVGK